MTETLYAIQQVRVLRGEVWPPTEIEGGVVGRRLQLSVETLPSRVGRMLAVEAPERYSDLGRQICA